ncbi:DUF1492 domain-containing protein [Clostridium paraputrificum]|uniref:DUF1492 domain-containing protein n=1 Tax=Clostridium paraputrificum TaxID=29363 RepID=UPI00374EDC45
MNYIKETVNILGNMNSLKMAERNIKLRIKEVRSEMSSTKAIEISDMPKGSGTGLPDDKICNLIFEEKELIKRLRETSKKISLLQRLLDGLSDDEKLILDKAYGEDSELKTDADIAKELNMSRRCYIDKKKRVTKKLAVQLWGIVAI